MLLGGLWHGASWTFVVWGGFHGLCLAVHRLWSRWRVGQAAGSSLLPGWLANGGSRVLTLSIVVIGWIFFRLPTLPEAWQYLSRLAAWTPDGVRMVSPQILGALVVVVLVHLSFERTVTGRMKFRTSRCRCASRLTLPCSWPSPFSRWLIPRRLFISSFEPARGCALWASQP